VSTQDRRIDGSRDRNPIASHQNDDEQLGVLDGTKQVPSERTKFSNSTVASTEVDNANSENAES
jgi:hypothetical protein